MKAVVSIAFFAILLVLLLRWNGASGTNYKQIIRSDGYGYYQYFPSLLGDNKMSAQVDNSVYLVKTKEGKVVNKYFVGTALLESPFVLPVYCFKLVRNTKVDFYGEAFQKAISIAALFYLLLALMALRALLKLYDIPEHIIAFSLFAFFFGSNLAYYSLIEPSMSHLYSFAAIAAFFYAFRRMQLQFSIGNFVLSSLLLSIIVLIRPVNILVVLFLPFLSGSFANFRVLLNKIFNSLSGLIIALSAFLIPLSIQLIMWKLQTGHFVVWSYAHEGFYFLHPQIGKFLFSFRKGFFIYTPLSLLAIVAYLYAYRKKGQAILLMLIPFALVIYVLSSWWNWYYGDSYGARVMIDYLPVIILLFALALNKTKLVFQRGIVLVSIFFVLLNILQSYQYYYSIISHFDMNKEKYFYSLNKIDKAYSNQLGGNDDIVSYHTQPLQMILDKSVNFDSNNCKYLYFNDKSENNSLVFNKDNEFGLSFKFPANLFTKYRELYCTLSNNTTLYGGSMNKVFWTLSYLDSNFTVYAYYKFKINGVPAATNTTRHDRYRFRLPPPKAKGDIIQIALWNYGKANFKISDVNISIRGIVE